MSEAQHCFSSSVGTLKFTQLSSWLPPTLEFPEPAEHCSLQSKTFHVTWWPTGYAQLKVPQHIRLQQRQSISNVTTASSLRKLLKKWCQILLLCHELAAEVVLLLGHGKENGCAVIFFIFGHLRCSINGFKNKCQFLGKAELKILSVSDVKNAHCFEEQTKTELLPQRT